MEFPYRDQQHMTYNLIVQELQTQLDDNGHIIKLFKQIIGHCKLPNAVDKQDQYHVLPNGQKVSKRTSNGWDLEIKWSNGQLVGSS